MARILVVDDNNDIRRMLRELLERAGYEVDDTHSADDALRSYRGQRADVEYVRVLHLAASTMESQVEEALEELLGEGEKLPAGPRDGNDLDVWELP